MDKVKDILEDLKKGYEHLESALENLKEEENKIDRYTLEQLNYFFDKVAVPYGFIERRLELLKEKEEGLK